MAIDQVVMDFFLFGKIQHILRCTPSHRHSSLDNFDDLLISGLSYITNCNVTDPQRLQACLPVRDGGLGIRKCATLASSALMASAASTCDLQNAILANYHNIKDDPAIC